jgi:hypothetical protein
MVRAKFKCYDVAETTYGNIAVSFGAVYGTEGENKDFCKATPCGNLLMDIDKGTKASTEFVRGKEYYLDFTEVK